MNKKIIRGRLEYTESMLRDWAALEYIRACEADSLERHKRVAAIKDVQEAVVNAIALMEGIE